jgi:hypothetical protein
MENADAQRLNPDTSPTRGRLGKNKGPSPGALTMTTAMTTAMMMMSRHRMIERAHRLVQIVGRWRQIHGSILQADASATHTLLVAREKEWKRKKVTGKREPHRKNRDEH